MPVNGFDATGLAALIGSATVQVALAYKNAAKDWDFQRLPLYGGAPDAFRDRAEAAVINLRDTRAARTYDPEWELGDDEYFVIDLGTPPLGGNFFTKLADFATLPTFVEKKRVRKPSAWVIIAQLDDASVAYFGARITARGILDQAGKAIRIVHRDEGFDTLDDTVITFEAEVDWLVWKKKVAIVDSKGFHAVFRDIPELLAQVDANLTQVTQNVGIENLDAFRQRIRSYPAMALKLSRIVGRGNMHTRSSAELRAYAADYSIEIEWNGDDMVFDGDIARQWNILRLLDEGRTLGPVTGTKYDTAGKVAI